ncbi:MAG: Rieske (2Fe-2S) protein [Actinomycetota bacterium]|nr:Rieske (2Fe-2S) protein [Actinomycetota bacterium]
MTDDTPYGSEVARRAVLAGAGAVAACAALVACGGSVQQYAASPPRTPAAPPNPAAPPTTASPAQSEPGGSASERLAATSDIPVGGGAVIAGKKVVVTQPMPGTFAAFSAICTHQGCTVNKVANGTIDCPCHGSKFAIADGSVVQGPASRPLARRQITVSGDAIVLA